MGKIAPVLWHQQLNNCKIQEEGWDRESSLKANRTPTNRRYYTYVQYLQFKGINAENDNRQIVIYARVSTRNQGVVITVMKASV